MESHRIRQLRRVLLRYFLVLCFIIVSVPLSHASCDHIYSNTANPNGQSSPIASEDANYYRGAILDVDSSRGICSVTAYLSALAGTITSQNFRVRIWSLDGDNLGSLLGTSDDSFCDLGGNWTATPKTFHFRAPIHVPSGRIAVMVYNGNTSATNYAGWDQVPAATGNKACSWSWSTGDGNCTIEYSYRMEVQYVDSPYLTATPRCSNLTVGAPPYCYVGPNYSYMGYLEIPEWTKYGANLCKMDDNITIACEVPGELMLSGNHKLRARFCPRAEYVPAVEGQFGDLNYATDTDNTTLTWTTGGDADWTLQTSGSHDGVDVAQGGALSNAQSTWIQTTVTGPGTLTFWWNVSSEAGYDFLGFYIDGVAQSGAISGPSHAWEQKTYEIETGEHILKWTYATNDGVLDGTNQAWLDQVTFSNMILPTPGYQPDDNKSLCSSWAHFRYSIRDAGGNATTITKHSHGDSSATITGEYR